jgi:Tfp pilus assembly protein PilO
MDLGADTVASWAAIGLSVVAMLVTAWTRYRDSSKEDLERIQEDLAELKSHRDRMLGANPLNRLRDVEMRQRETDTAMARVEQRLNSIDTLLAQIAQNVQQLVHSGRDA